MKKLLSICLMLFISTYVYSHCGSCGTGDSHHQPREISSELSENQQVELKKLNNSYSKQFRKLENNYKKDLSAIVGKKMTKKYEKEYCSVEKRMMKKACSKKSKKNKKEDCYNCESNDT